MTLDGVHVIDSWLLQRHYAKAGVHQALRHSASQVCYLHLPAPVAGAEPVPSGLREAGSYGWLAGGAGRSHLVGGLGEEEGNCSHARKGGSTAEHRWPSTVGWQTLHGPAASTNLCPFVLHVIPLSDFVNSSSKISQPK